MAPLELTLELIPRARFDVIDVRARAAAEFGGALDAYPSCLCCSLHTTAGYLDQSLAARLNGRPSAIAPYVDVFRALFPEGAGYRHDDLERRQELSREQRLREPRNADSHLAYITAGLRSCVPYVLRRGGPIPFIDLDGVGPAGARRRRTTLVGYHREEEVGRLRVSVPVSRHLMDSVNLKDPSLGLYEQLTALVTRHEVRKGRLRLELGAGELQAGLTVNEYETLLMRHDLAEVLRDPLRFAAEKARHVVADPRAVPMKTLDYAKYDLVRAFNRLVDALGLGESRLEWLAARLLALPAARFLRLKRSVSLLVSDQNTPGHGTILAGVYQSPILVQWARATRATRQIDVVLTRFV